jgi:hypothetical protein
VRSCQRLSTRARCLRHFKRSDEKAAISERQSATEDSKLSRRYDGRHNLYLKGPKPVLDASSIRDLPLLHLFLAVWWGSAAALVPTSIR